MRGNSAVSRNTGLGGGAGGGGGGHTRVWGGTVEVISWGRGGGKSTGLGCTGRGGGCTATA